MSNKEKSIFEGLSDEQLDSKVSDIHIAEIAHDLVDWESLVSYLGITENEQNAIKEAFPKRYNLQKRQALRIWRWKNGNKATYRNLIRACCSTEMAEKIAMVQQPVSSTSDLFYSFHQYLFDCYRNLPYPGTNQWPISVCIPTKYFDLSLRDQSPPFDVDVGETILLKSIRLSDILESDKRLLVYFEGIAGCGKSTLSWHACREWANGRLLRQFELLIYIQLNDPQVQLAMCLRDIIPHPDEAFRQKVATAIATRKGKGVCFLLDGLDTAPTSLFNSLLVDIAKGKFGGQQLPKASFIFTSRSSSHVTWQLQSVLTSHITITGFSKESMHQFFDSSLGPNSDERQKLKTLFAISPELEYLCSIPVYAVSMSVLMEFNIRGDITATTQTSLYLSLIGMFLTRCCIESSISEPVLIDLHADITSEISKPFNQICSIAYSSLLNNKHFFTATEVGTIPNEMLGFLQVSQRNTIATHGLTRFIYNFANLSLQEFLAAVHITKMSKIDQTSAIKELLSRNSPLSQVIPFYAGLTKLSNKDVLRALLNSLRKALYQSIRGKDTSQGQHILLFFNCLFESQNEQLLQQPETDLPIDTSCDLGIEDVLEIQAQLQATSSAKLRQSSVQHTLPLHGLVLTPADCLSLGYYICTKSQLTTNLETLMEIALICCKIDSIGMRLFCTAFKKNIKHRTPIRVLLHLNGIKFNNESLLSLKDLVEGQSNLESLGLIDCLDTSLAINFALKCLIEGASTDSSCGFFDLSENNYNSSHIHYFILMLRGCPRIYGLHLRHYNLHGQIMPLFCSALELASLQFLDVSYCNITDTDLALLGKVISLSPFLEHLGIYGNPITSSGVSQLFAFLLRNIHFNIMMVLVLDPELQLSIEQSKTLEKINRFRARFHYPPLIVKYCKESQTYQQHSDVLSRLQKKSTSISQSYKLVHDYNPTHQNQETLQVHDADEAKLQAASLLSSKSP